MNKTSPELIKNFSNAEKLFSQGKYYEAIKKYKKILISYPNLIIAVNNIGLCYEYLNQLEDSIKCYKKCSITIPKEKIFINNIANIYYKKKDYNNAIKELEKSLLIDDSQAEIIEKTANCLLKLNLKDKAHLFFKKYIKKIPKSTLLNTLYGKNLIALNKHKEGLEFLRKGTGFIEFNENKVNII